MNEKQTKAFVSCIRDNAVRVTDLYSFLNTIRPGDFHFTDGSHFPDLIPGLTADGVFVNNRFYLTKYERNGETTKSRAERFCRHRGCVLPDRKTRDEIIENSGILNASLSKLEFPLLEYGDYWSSDDEGSRLTEPYSYDSSDSYGITYAGGDVGDTIYNVPPSTPKEYFRKRVRGCLEVSQVKRSPVLTKVKPVDTGEETPGDVILKAFGVTRFEFMQYLAVKDGFTKPGCYLLKNGDVSATTVYDSEAGIFADAGLYIKLNMPENPMTAKQTTVWLKAYGTQLPDYFGLRRISAAAPEINKALDAVGMRNFSLPDDVLNSCWCKETLEKAVNNAESGSPAKKRLLPVGTRDVNPKYLKYLMINDIWSRFSPE